MARLWFSLLMDLLLSDNYGFSEFAPKLFHWWIKLLYLIYKGALCPMFPHFLMLCVARQFLLLCQGKNYVAQQVKL